MPWSSDFVSLALEHPLVQGVALHIWFGLRCLFFAVAHFVHLRPFQMSDLNIFWYLLTLCRFARAYGMDGVGHHLLG